MWREVDGYYFESDCGYRVSKTYTREECVYSAWARRAQRNTPNPISMRCLSVEDAQRICEEHHAAQQQDGGAGVG